MSTQQNPEPLTDAEVRALNDKLEAWAAGLSAREQYIMAALLTDSGAGDVQGYGSGFGGSDLAGPASLGGWTLFPLPVPPGFPAAQPASGGAPSAGASRPPSTGVPTRQV
jgi:hypothetical protein